VVETVHGLVCGHVQGVGFRWHLLRHAHHHRIAGWVRNLPDGRVEFVAQATRQPLERFLEQVRRGPAGSRVSALEEDWLADHPELGPFSIA
jgi:acylphosphatase